MPRTRNAVAALLAAAPIASAQSAFFNSITQAGGASAQGYAPTFGYPIIVSGPGLGGADGRAAWEYSIDSLPAHFQLTALRFQFNANFPMGIPFFSQIYAYAGDGVIDPLDFLRTSISVGPSPRVEGPGAYQVGTSNLSALNAALGSGSVRYLGILMVSTGGTFCAIDGDSLRLDWTPIPTPATAIPLALGVAMLGRRRR